MNNNVISKIVADLWRLETSEVKAVYAAKAEAEKRAHMLKYPGYKYQPRKSAKRVAEAAVKKSSAKSSKKAKTHALPPATDHQAMPPMVMEHHHHQHQPAIPAELESFWASNPEYQSPDGAVYDWPHVMDYSSHPPYNHPSHFPHHLQETQPGYYAYPDYHNFSDAYLMPPQEP